MKSLSSETKPLVILTAGGTGGHVYPAEALALELKVRGCDIVFVTDARGDKRKGSLSEVETYHVSAKGVFGKGLPTQIFAVISLFLGVLKARFLISKLRPDVIIGFGGYASMPMMLAAIFSATPRLIHEQNALLGRANRLLAGTVNKIASSYSEVFQVPQKALKKITYTGMPVRASVDALREIPYPEFGHSSKMNILIFGGSQGASIFSKVVPNALKKLGQDVRSKLEIVQQCRLEDLLELRSTYENLSIRSDISIFFDDLPERISKAHLIISRAGASTLAEVTTIGRPSILVPYPHAIDDHQSFNAKNLEERGGAWLINNHDFNSQILASRLEDLIEAPKRLKDAALAAKKIGAGCAVKNLADLVMPMIAGDPTFDRGNV